MFQIPQSQPSANPASVNQAYAGMSNYAYPGETGTAAARRMQLEFERRGQTNLPTGVDAQLPGGGGAWGQGGMGAVGGAGGAGGGGDVEAWRNSMFNALNEQAGFYGQGPGQALSSAIMRQLYGTDAPFTRPVTDAMFSAQADASAGQAGREQEALRQGFAASGIGGSGGQVGAQVDAVRGHGARTRQARRDIDATAATENYAARERAQQRMSQLLAQDAANRLATTQLGTGAMLQYQQAMGGGAGGGMGGAGIPGMTLGGVRYGSGMGPSLGGLGQDTDAGNAGAITGRTEGWQPGQAGPAPTHYYGGGPIGSPYGTGMTPASILAAMGMDAVVAAPPGPLDPRSQPLGPTGEPAGYLSGPQPLPTLQFPYSPTAPTAPVGAVAGSGTLGAGPTIYGSGGGYYPTAPIGSGTLNLGPTPY